MFETSIIIPTNKNSKTIWDCVYSIVQYTNNYQLIFAVNEKSAFSEKLEAYGHVFFSPDPFCFSKSVNKGISRSGGAYLAILNDDVIVHKDWLKKMHHTNKTLGPGIVGARCQGHGCSNVQAHGPGHAKESDYTINMFATLIPWHVFKIIGPLDERFSFYGGEDCDYTLRAHRHGIKVLISDAEVTHIKSQSFGMKRILEELPKTREIFKEKWGVCMPIPPKQSWKDEERANLLNPLVSILMPTRNHAEHIESAIESVLNQTYKNIELLIGVDGADQEETLSRIGKVNDTRLRIAPTISHIGSCRMRNKLFKESKGEFIALMDSDDLMLPDRIEKQLGAMDAETDIVHSSFIIEKDRSRITPSMHPINIHSMLQMKSFPAGGTFLMRRFVLKEDAFDENFNRAFDFEFVLRCHDNYRFKFMPDPVIVYRRHSGEHLSGNAESIRMHHELIRRYKNER